MGICLRWGSSGNQTFRGEQVKAEMERIVKEAMMEWEKMEIDEDLPIRQVPIERYIVAKLMFWWERLQDRR